MTGIRTNLDNFMFDFTLFIYDLASKDATTAAKFVKAIQHSDHDRFSLISPVLTNLLL